MRPGDCSQALKETPTLHPAGETDAGTLILSKGDWPKASRPSESLISEGRLSNSR